MNTGLETSQLTAPYKKQILINPLEFTVMTLIMSNSLGININVAVTPWESRTKLLKYRVCILLNNKIWLQPKYPVILNKYVTHYNIAD